jgi:phosphoribosylformylglycinamidine cyclo-ligase
MSDARRYREAGVDLDAAEAAKHRIVASVQSTRTALARGALGAFGGMLRLPADVRDPVLVMSTDGVGTKVLVAIAAQRHDTVGEDLVNHCVNDILVHGARPIAFLDYIATATMDVATVAALVEGVARGCRAHGMTLVGGETAQLPDLYHPGHYDLAGTIVGVVSEGAAIHGERVRPGDVLVGYAASGLHTNGYTLARRILFGDLGLDVAAHVPALGTTVGEALLAVHRSYWAALAPVLDRVHALAHITGGGIPGNLARPLPDGCGAVVRSGTWPVPPLFAFLQEAGRVSPDEMDRVFNMGVGMIAVAPAAAVAALRDAAGTAGVETWVIGEIVAGAGVRVIR